MRRVSRLGLGLMVFGAIAGTLPSQEQAPILDSYDLSEDSGLQGKLPRVLEEVSGLASAPDGRLFAHNDERSVVYALDPVTRDITKSFSVGSPAIPGDFEGIAIAGDRFFLVTSAGTLMEFREGGDGTSVPYRLHNLGLRTLCEMEGLAYDPIENTLLMPCKTPRARRLEDHLVVFSVSLESMRLDPTPRIFIPLKALDENGLGDDFHPSAIEVHPRTRSIIVVAAREEALVELSSRGEILGTRELKRKRHPQPEGLAFLADSSLVLADEGQGKRGTLTRYFPEAKENGPKG